MIWLEESFAHPWVLLTLLAVPLVGLWRWRQERLAATAFAPLQYQAPPAGRRRLARLLIPLELLVLVVLLVALAGPRRFDRLDLLDDEGIDVVLVLDVSLSMLAEDFEPNRLEVLRRLARDFVHRSGNNRLGLVVFAGDTFVHTPMTTHHGAVLSLIEDITVELMSPSKSGGTAIGDALLVAADQLDSVRVEGRDQALVLITDGENNEGSDPLLAARYVRHLGIRCALIGVGGLEPMEVFYEGRRLGGDDNPYLAVLDDDQLQAIADAAGGRYQRALDAGALERIFADLSRLESAPLEARTVEITRPRAPWLALVLLPLFAGTLWLGGWVLRRPLR